MYKNFQILQKIIKIIEIKLKTKQNQRIIYDNINV